MRTEAGPNEDNIKAVRRWGGILTALHVALVVPVILFGRGHTDEAGDQQVYHEPFILRLAAEWPQVDLVDTHGLAMTPGYYLTLAGIRHYTGADVTMLRLLTAGLSLPLIWFLFWFGSRWTDPKTAFFLTLALMLSPFVMGSAMWLRSDNVSFGLITLCLGLVSTQRADPKKILVWGFVTLLAVSVRQISLWLLAPIGVACLIALFPGIVPHSVRNDLPGNDEARAKRKAFVVLAGWLAAAAPIALLAYFYHLWGGLLPPSVAEKHAVGNGLKIVPVIFALTGFFGLFLGPLAWEKPLKELLKHRLVVSAALLALLVCLVPRTADPAGPSGFLVELRKTPVAFGRILILLPFSALGGAALAVVARAAWRAGRQRAALFVLLGFAAWTFAMTANVYVFRRYCEPFIVLTLSWLTAMGLPNGGRGVRFWSFLAALIAAQLLVLAVKIYLPAFSLR